MATDIYIYILVAPNISPGGSIKGRFAATEPSAYLTAFALNKQRLLQEEGAMLGRGFGGGVGPGALERFQLCRLHGCFVHWSPCRHDGHAHQATVVQQQQQHHPTPHSGLRTGGIDLCDHVTHESACVHVSCVSSLGVSFAASPKPSNNSSRIRASKSSLFESGGQNCLTARPRPEPRFGSCRAASLSVYIPSGVFCHEPTISTYTTTLKGDKEVGGRGKNSQRRVVKES